MLEALEDGIDFCSRRGLGTIWIEGACPAVLFELGQIEQALEMAGRLAKSAEAIGDHHIAAELQMISVQHAAEAGGNADIDHVDALIDRAPEAGLSTPRSTPRDRSDRPRQGRARARNLALTRLDQMPGATATPYYARFLPGAVRTAIAAGELELGDASPQAQAALRPTRTRALRPEPSSPKQYATMTKRRRCMPMQPSPGKAWQRPRTRLRPARPRPLPYRARTTRGGTATGRERRSCSVHSGTSWGSPRPTSCCAD